MRFLRFLVRELLLHGIVFAVVGTIVLSCLYLVSIGAPADAYLDAGRSFLLFISGNANSRTVGFTSGQIIVAGAIQTFPLAMISLVFVILIALVCSSYAVTSRYMAVHFAKKNSEVIEKIWSFIASILAAVPLFIGFWVAYVSFGNGVPLFFIALVTVILGGLSWDATNFLKTDMINQVNQTHAIVFSTLGRNLGNFSLYLELIQATFSRLHYHALFHIWQVRYRL